MTQFQTDHAKGRFTPPVAYGAGHEMVAVYEYTFDRDYTAASDIIELGPLPGTAKITGATLIGEGLGSTTANVGIMTGEPSEDLDAEGAQRALTADLLFDGVSVNNNEAEAAALTCMGIAKASDHRGIGATIAGNVAAGAAKKLTLVLRYTY